MTAWTDLLVGWSPMLIFIAIWIYFMSRPGAALKGTNEHFARSQKHMERVEELLGRIATALERR
jgi:ATP-dependent Zn protease